MSTPLVPEKAKLVISLFMQNRPLFSEVAEKLSDNFGRPDFVSEWMPFDFTTYYEPEMGSGLMRRMIAYENLIEQEALADIKLTTNRIENAFSGDGSRWVNLDPGYMLLSRFVLASGKDYTHKIYIGKGIYADLTLLYKNGGFISLPWSYPDYAGSKMIKLLEIIRRKYVNDLKKIRRAAEALKDSGEIR